MSASGFHTTTGDWATDSMASQDDETDDLDIYSSPVSSKYVQTKLLSPIPEFPDADAWGVDSSGEWPPMPTTFPQPQPHPLSSLPPVVALPQEVMLSNSNASASTASVSPQAPTGRHTPPLPPTVPLPIPPASSTDSMHAQASSISTQTSTPLPPPPSSTSSAFTSQLPDTLLPRDETTSPDTPVPGPAGLRVRPEQLSFPSVQPGFASTQHLQVRNTHTTPLRIRVSSSAPHRLAATPTTVALAPGATALVRVRVCVQDTAWTALLAQAQTQARREPPTRLGEAVSVGKCVDSRTGDVCVWEHVLLSTAMGEQHVPVALTLTHADTHITAAAQTSLSQSTTLVQPTGNTAAPTRTDVNAEDLVVVTGATLSPVSALVRRARTLGSRGVRAAPVTTDCKNAQTHDPPHTKGKETATATKTAPAAVNTTGEDAESGVGHPEPDARATTEPSAPTAPTTTTAETASGRAEERRVALLAAETRVLRAAFAQEAEARAAAEAAMQEREARVTAAEAYAAALVEDLAAAKAEIEAMEESAAVRVRVARAETEGVLQAEIAALRAAAAEAQSARELAEARAATATAAAEDLRERGRASERRWRGECARLSRALEAERQARREEGAARERVRARTGERARSRMLARTRAQTVGRGEERAQVDRSVERDMEDGDSNGAASKQPSVDTAVAQSAAPTTSACECDALRAQVSALERECAWLAAEAQRGREDADARASALQAASEAQVVGLRRALEEVASVAGTARRAVVVGDGVAVETDEKGGQDRAAAAAVGGVRAHTAAMSAGAGAVVVEHAREVEALVLAAQRAQATASRMQLCALQACESACAAGADAEARVGRAERAARETVAAAREREEGLRARVRALEHALEVGSGKTSVDARVWASARAAATAESVCAELRAALAREENGRARAEAEARKSREECARVWRAVAPLAMVAAAARAGQSEQTWACAREAVLRSSPLAGVLVDGDADAEARAGESEGVRLLRAVGALVCEAAGKPLSGLSTSATTQNTAAAYAWARDVCVRAVRGAVEWTLCAEKEAQAATKLPPTSTEAADVSVTNATQATDNAAHAEAGWAAARALEEQQAQLAVSLRVVREEAEAAVRAAETEREEVWEECVRRTAEAAQAVTAARAERDAAQMCVRVAEEENVQWRERALAAERASEEAEAAAQAAVGAAEERTQLALAAAATAEQTRREARERAAGAMEAIEVLVDVLEAVCGVRRSCACTQHVHTHADSTDDAVGLIDSADECRACLCVWGRVEAMQIRAMDALRIARVRVRSAGAWPGVVSGMPPSHAGAWDTGTADTETVPAHERVLGMAHVPVKEEDSEAADVLVARVVGLGGAVAHAVLQQARVRAAAERAQARAEAAEQRAQECEEAKRKVLSRVRVVEEEMRGWRARAREAEAAATALRGDIVGVAGARASERSSRVSLVARVETAEAEVRVLRAAVAQREEEMAQALTQAETACVQRTWMVLRASGVDVEALLAVGATGLSASDAASARELTKTRCALRVCVGLLDAAAQTAGEAWAHAGRVEREMALWRARASDLEGVVCALGLAHGRARMQMEQAVLRACSHADEGMQHMRAAVMAARAQQEVELARAEEAEARYQRALAEHVVRQEHAWSDADMAQPRASETGTTSRDDGVSVCVGTRLRDEEKNAVVEAVCEEVLGAFHNALAEAVDVLSARVAGTATQDGISAANAGSGASLVASHYNGLLYDMCAELNTRLCMALAAHALAVQDTETAERQADAARAAERREAGAVRDAVSALQESEERWRTRASARVKVVEEDVSVGEALRAAAETMKDADESSADNPLSRDSTHERCVAHGGAAKVCGVGGGEQAEAVGTSAVAAEAAWTAQTLARSARAYADTRSDTTATAISDNTEESCDICSEACACALGVARRTLAGVCAGKSAAAEATQTLHARTQALEAAVHATAWTGAVDVHPHTVHKHTSAGTHDAVCSLCAALSHPARHSVSHALAHSACTHTAAALGAGPAEVAEAAARVGGAWLLGREEGGLGGDVPVMSRCVDAWARACRDLEQASLRLRGKADNNDEAQQWQPSTQLREAALDPYARAVEAVRREVRAQAAARTAQEALVVERARVRTLEGLLARCGVRSASGNSGTKKEDTTTVRITATAALRALGVRVDEDGDVNTPPRSQRDQDPRSMRPTATTTPAKALRIARALSSLLREFVRVTRASALQARELTALRARVTSHEQALHAVARTVGACVVVAAGPCACSNHDDDKSTGIRGRSDSCCVRVRRAVAEVEAVLARAREGKTREAKTTTATRTGLSVAADTTAARAVITVAGPQVMRMSHPAHASADSDACTCSEICVCGMTRGEDMEAAVQEWVGALGSAVRKDATQTVSMDDLAIAQTAVARAWECVRTAGDAAARAQAVADVCVSALAQARAEVFQLRASVVRGSHVPCEHCDAHALAHARMHDSAGGAMCDMNTPNTNNARTAPQNAMPTDIAGAKEQLTANNNAAPRHSNIHTGVSSTPSLRSAQPTAALPAPPCESCDGPCAAPALSTQLADAQQCLHAAVLRADTLSTEVLTLRRRLTERGLRSAIASRTQGLHSVADAGTQTDQRGPAPSPLRPRGMLPPPPSTDNKAQVPEAPTMSSDDLNGPPTSTSATSTHVHVDASAWAPPTCASCGAAKSACLCAACGEEAVRRAVEAETAARTLGEMLAQTQRAWREATEAWTRTHAHMRAPTSTQEDASADSADTHPSDDAAALDAALSGAVASASAACAWVHEGAVAVATDLAALLAATASVHVDAADMSLSATTSYHDFDGKDTTHNVSMHEVRVWMPVGWSAGAVRAVCASAAGAQSALTALTTLVDATADARAKAAAALAATASATHAVEQKERARRVAEAAVTQAKEREHEAQARATAMQTQWEETRTQLRAAEDAAAAAQAKERAALVQVRDAEEEMRRVRAAVASGEEGAALRECVRALEACVGRVTREKEEARAWAESLSAALAAAEARVQAVEQEHQVTAAEHDCTNVVQSIASVSVATAATVGTGAHADTNASVMSAPMEIAVETVERALRQDSEHALRAVAAAVRQGSVASAHVAAKCVYQFLQRRRAARTALTQTLRAYVAGTDVDDHTSLSGTSESSADVKATLAASLPAATTTPANTTTAPTSATTAPASAQWLAALRGSMFGTGPQLLSGVREYTQAVADAMAPSSATPTPTPLTPTALPCGPLLTTLATSMAHPSAPAVSWPEAALAAALARVDAADAPSTPNVSSHLPLPALPTTIHGTPEWQREEQVRAVQRQRGREHEVAAAIARATAPSPPMTHPARSDAPTRAVDILHNTSTDSIPLLQSLASIDASTTTTNTDASLGSDAAAGRMSTSTTVAPVHADALLVVALDAVEAALAEAELDDSMGHNWSSLGTPRAASDTASARDLDHSYVWRYAGIGTMSGTHVAMDSSMLAGLSFSSTVSAHTHADTTVDARHYTLDDIHATRVDDASFSLEKQRNGVAGTGIPTNPSRAELPPLPLPALPTSSHTSTATTTATSTVPITPAGSVQPHTRECSGCVEARAELLALREAHADALTRLATVRSTPFRTHTTQARYSSHDTCRDTQQVEEAVREQATVGIDAAVAATVQAELTLAHERAMSEASVLRARVRMLCGARHAQHVLRRALTRAAMAATSALARVETGAMEAIPSAAWRDGEDDTIVNDTATCLCGTCGSATAQTGEAEAAAQLLQAEVVDACTMLSAAATHAQHEAALARMEADECLQRERTRVEHNDSRVAPLTHLQPPPTTVGPTTRITTPLATPRGKEPCNQCGRDCIRVCEDSWRDRSAGMAASVREWRRECERVEAEAVTARSQRREALEAVRAATAAAAREARLRRDAESQARLSVLAQEDLRAVAVQARQTARMAARAAEEAVGRATAAEARVEETTARVQAAEVAAAAAERKAKEEGERAALALAASAQAQHALAAVEARAAQAEESARAQEEEAQRLARLVQSLEADRHKYRRGCSSDEEEKEEPDGAGVNTTRVVVEVLGATADTARTATEWSLLLHEAHTAHEATAVLLAQARAREREAEEAVRVQRGVVEGLRGAAAVAAERERAAVARAEEMAAATAAAHTEARAAEAAAARAKEETQRAVMAQRASAAALMAAQEQHRREQAAAAVVHAQEQEKAATEAAARLHAVEAAAEQREKAITAQWQAQLSTLQAETARERAHVTTLLTCVRRLAARHCVFARESRVARAALQARFEACVRAVVARWEQERCALVGAAALAQQRAAGDGRASLALAARVAKRGGEEEACVLLTREVGALQRQLNERDAALRAMRAQKRAVDMTSIEAGANSVAHTSMDVPHASGESGAGMHARVWLLDDRVEEQAVRELVRIAQTAATRAGQDSNALPATSATGVDVSTDVSGVTVRAEMCAVGPVTGVSEDWSWRSQDLSRTMQHSHIGQQTSTHDTCACGCVGCAATLAAAGAEVRALVQSVAARDAVVLALRQRLAATGSLAFRAKTTTVPTASAAVAPTATQPHAAGQQVWKILRSLQQRHRALWTAHQSLLQSARAAAHDNNKAANIGDHCSSQRPRKRRTTRVAVTAKQASEVAMPSSSPCECTSLRMRVHEMEEHVRTLRAAHQELGTRYKHMCERARVAAEDRKTAETQVRAAEEEIAKVQTQARRAAERERSAREACARYRKVAEDAGARVETLAARADEAEKESARVRVLLKQEKTLGAHRAAQVRVLRAQVEERDGRAWTFVGEAGPGSMHIRYRGGHAEEAAGEEDTQARVQRKRPEVLMLPHTHMHSHTHTTNVSSLPTAAPSSTHVTHIYVADGAAVREVVHALRAVVNAGCARVDALCAAVQRTRADARARGLMHPLTTGPDTVSAAAVAALASPSTHSVTAHVLAPVAVGAAANAITVADNALCLCETCGGDSAWDALVLGALDAAVQARTASEASSSASTASAAERERAAATQELVAQVAMLAMRVREMRAQRSLPCVRAKTHTTPQLPTATYASSDSVGVRVRAGFDEGVRAILAMHTLPPAPMPVPTDAADAGTEVMDATTRVCECHDFVCWCGGGPMVAATALAPLAALASSVLRAVSGAAGALAAMLAVATQIERGTLTWLPSGTLACSQQLFRAAAEAEVAGVAVDALQHRMTRAQCGCGRTGVVAEGCVGAVVCGECGACACTCVCVDRAVLERWPGGVASETDQLTMPARPALPVGAAQALVEENVRLQVRLRALEACAADARSAALTQSPRSPSSPRWLAVREEAATAAKIRAQVSHPLVSVQPHAGETANAANTVAGDIDNSIATASPASEAHAATPALETRACPNQPTPVPLWREDMPVATQQMPTNDHDTSANVVVTEEAEYGEDDVSAVLAASERARSHIRLLLAADADEEDEEEEQRHMQSTCELAEVAVRLNGLGRTATLVPTSVALPTREEGVVKDGEDEVVALLSVDDRAGSRHGYATSEPAWGTGYSEDTSVATGATSQAGWGVMLQNGRPKKQGGGAVDPGVTPLVKVEEMDRVAVARGKGNEDSEELDFFFRL